MPGEEEEEEEELSLSGDEKTCLIGILFPSFHPCPLLFSLLLLPRRRWSRIRKDSHFLLEEEEEEVCFDKQLHGIDLSIGTS